VWPLQVFSHLARRTSTLTFYHSLVPSLSGTARIAYTAAVSSALVLSGGRLAALLAFAAHVQGSWRLHASLGSAAL